MGESVSSKVAACMVMFVPAGPETNPTEAPPEETWMTDGEAPTYSVGGTISVITGVYAGPEEMRLMCVIVM